MINPVTIYFHADCLDGFGAAYAAWRRFGDAARYRPMHHGDPWQPEDVAGREVYILDYAFPKAQLFEMARIALSVCQLDHHASASDPWRKQLVEQAGTGLLVFEDPALSLMVAFDLQKSGARMAWEHFQAGHPVPSAIAHIEDQDTWRFAIPRTRAFCRALRMRPFAFDTWHQVVADAEPACHDLYLAFCAEGEAVERFLAIELDRLATSSLLMPVGLDTGSALVNGLAINASAVFSSELGHRLAERSGTFGLIWQLGGDGLVRVSLRAAGEVDVARIAERFGGGGHPNAAGFRMQLDRFRTQILAITP